ncbi:hypothetical protein [Chishuiella sp.]|uniref:hypothetical protein n=1 Tax=Chishuiella sp. TaxID=1969467 RepID=UPI0028AF1030|nr:hypothetical protein [Chishuiella sp.]
MKQVIYIFLTIIFASIIVNISSISTNRDALKVYGNHHEKIDKGTKALLQIDNFNLLSIDESKSDIEFTPFNFNLFDVFLNSYFYQKPLQLYSYIEKIYYGKTLPKYILFHSLQVDYI